jgi:hypothetical protein
LWLLNLEKIVGGYSGCTRCASGRTIASDPNERQDDLTNFSRYAEAGLISDVGRCLEWTRWNATEVGASAIWFERARPRARVLRRMCVNAA